MRKLCNTEAELKKVLLIKKACNANMRLGENNRKKYL